MFRHYHYLKEELERKRARHCTNNVCPKRRRSVKLYVYAGLGVCSFLSPRLRSYFVTLLVNGDF